MKRLAATVALLITSSVFAQSGQSIGIKVSMRSRFDAVGPWAGFMTSTSGSGTNGCVTVVTHRGARLVTGGHNPDTGCLVGSWIADFDEGKTYRLNPVEREYAEQSFGDVRRRIASSYSITYQAREGAEMFLPTTGVDLPKQSRARAGRFEYTAAVKETGQRKQMFGSDAREIVLTVTAVERGKTMEVDGGWVITSTIWLGSRMPLVDDLVSALRRYSAIVTKGVFDNPYTDIEFPMNEFFDPTNPEQTVVGARVVAEMGKLDGTVLANTSIYEMERTAKEWKGAQDHYTAQQRRLTAIGARVLGGPPPKRERIITLQTEIVGIDSNVTEADVAIPAGYKKK